MTERFRRVFSLANNLYSKGCPIIIEAGALQKDTETGNVLAQIKMKNIGKKVISSCKVKLRAFENNGDEIEGVKGFSYLDLNAGAGDEFGGKTPVFLPDATARSFSISIDEIVYDDNSICSDVFNEWVPIPKQKTVKKYLNKTELIEQYAIEVGGASRYVPVLKDNLFICGCGTINDVDNKKCYRCGKTYSVLKKHLNVETLSKAAAQRIAAEKAEKQAADEKRKARNIKIVKAVVLACALILLSIAGFFSYNAITHSIEQKELQSKYEAALDDYNNKDYEDALQGFKELKDYKDSSEMYWATRARLVSEELQSGEYDYSIKTIQRLDEVQSSEGELGAAVDQAFMDYYAQAVNLVNNKNFTDAEKLLSVLYDNSISYKDSDSYYSYCLVAEKARSDLEENDVSLGELYRDIKELGGFNNSEELIKNNKYLSQIEAMEGTWKVVERHDWEDLEKITISDGRITLTMDGFDYDGYFDLNYGDLVARTSSYDFATIEVDGDRMKYSITFPEDMAKSVICERQ